MKKRTLLWTLTLLLSVSTAYAQDVPVEVVAAFKKGSAVELGRFFGDKVELIIQKRTSTANKQTAENTMAKFFADNKVKGFTVNHQGKRDESSFVVGTLSTANGDFRINCYFKRMQDKYLIHQIRIDKTNE